MIAPFAFGTGVLAGIVLDALTFVVARYGPSASDGIAWSFRGNGALIVPFGLGPAVLAGGWTALVLHARPGVSWLHWGIAVGLVGAGLFLASAEVLFAVGVVGAFYVAELFVSPGS